MNPRVIEIPGVYNFRDIGGYATTDGRAVGWRRVFRSGELHRQTGQGLTAIRDDLRLRASLLA